MGNSNRKSHKYPKIIKNLKNIVKIDSTSNHNFALDKNYNIWIWGLNNTYQLGINIINKVIDIPLNIFKNVKDFSTSLSHSAYIDFDNNIFIFGKSNEGAFANNSLITSSYLPIKICNKTINNNTINIYKIKCGIFQTSIITDNGNLYSSGSNIFNKLGISQKTNLTKFDYII